MLHQPDEIVADRIGNRSRLIAQLAAGFGMADPAIRQKDGNAVRRDDRMEMKPVGQAGQNGGAQLDDPDRNGEDAGLSGADHLAFDPDDLIDGDLVAGQDIALAALAALGDRQQALDDIPDIDKIVGPVEGQNQAQGADGIEIAKQAAHFGELVIVGTDHPARKGNNRIQTLPGSGKDQGGGFRFGPGIAFRQTRHRELLDFRDFASVLPIRQGMDRADIDQADAGIFLASFNHMAGAADIDLIDPGSGIQGGIDQACQMEDQPGTLDRGTDIGCLADVAVKQLQGKTVETVQDFPGLEKNPDDFIGVMPGKLMDQDMADMASRTGYQNQGHRLLSDQPAKNRVLSWTK